MEHIFTNNYSADEQNTSPPSCKPCGNPCAKHIKENKTTEILKSTRSWSFAHAFYVLLFISLYSLYCEANSFICRN